MVEGHVSTDTLVRLADGALSEDERGIVLRHLEVCEECGDQLAGILALRQHGLRARRQRYAMAAVAATVLLAAVLFVFEPFTVAEPPMSPERRELVDRWATYASRDSMRPTILDFTLRVGYPDVVPASPSHHLPRTREALVDLLEGRNEDAVQKLIILHSDYPDFDSIAGWLGIALHVSGETDPLIEGLLERGERSEIDPLSNHSVWYGAQHLMLVGRPEEAVAKLQIIAPMRISIGRDAKALLERLPLEELGLEDDAQAPAA